MSELRRRKDDPRIERLVVDVAQLLADMKVVRDTVAAFAAARSAAKWLTVIITALAAGVGLSMSVKTAWDTFFKPHI